MDKKNQPGQKPLKPLPIAGELVESELDKVSGGFLKLGDIKGESLDDKHKDTIEVLAYK